MRVLLLGGTAEARELATRLTEAGAEVVTSLAGRVARPRLPAGQVRVGGFGGVTGLAEAAGQYDAVVDATHPFAATISASAVTACERAGVRLLRLARPGWSSRPGADRWHWVDSHERAAETAARLAGRPESTVFLTTGRQSLDRFVPLLGERPVLVRVVDPVEQELPATWTVLLARGPYDLGAERSLLRERGVGVLVTKDSGGGLTRAKLDAADELGVPVVVVRRPPAPAGVETVSDVADAVRWVDARTGPG